MIKQINLYCYLQCSTSCGAGIKTRKKSCQRLKETGVFEPVPEVMCSAATVPPLQEGCNQDVKCPGIIIIIIVVIIIIIIIIIIIRDSECISKRTRNSAKKWRN